MVQRTLCCAYSCVHDPHNSEHRHTHVCQFPRPVSGNLSITHVTAGSVGQLLVYKPVFWWLLAAAMWTATAPSNNESHRNTPHKLPHHALIYAHAVSTKFDSAKKRCRQEYANSRTFAPTDKRVTPIDWHEQCEFGTINLEQNHILLRKLCKFFTLRLDDKRMSTRTHNHPWVGNTDYERTVEPIYTKLGILMFGT